MMNVCSKCGIRLSTKNWYPSYKDRNKKTCKTCQLLSDRKRSLREYMKQYYIDNPDKYKKQLEMSKVYNRKRYKEGLTWRQQHPEETLEYMKKYRKRKKEEKLNAK